MMMRRFWIHRSLLHSDFSLLGKMYVIILLSFVYLLQYRVDAKCSYSFVVNEVDPSSCPCLLEQASVGRGGGGIQGHQNPAKGSRTWIPQYPSALGNNHHRNHHHRNKHNGRKGEDDNHNDDDNHHTIEIINDNLHEGSAVDNNMRELNDDGINIDKSRLKNEINTGNFQYEFERLQSTMKDLEIKVYQESVENRELKNIVMRQEQSLKDYKYLVEKLKMTITRQKVEDSRDKNSLIADMSVLKDTVETMKQSLNKQDYYLKSLEKSTHSLRLHLSPSSYLPVSDTVVDRSNSKVIPVESTSNAMCDGISKNATRYKDCDELFQRGHKLSGVYYVKPSFVPCPIPVYCDMDIGGAGWLVIQRRQDGTENFNRNWQDYKNGFGDLNGEFWLGNDNIFLLTNQASYRLRIDLWDFNDTHRYAEYLYFTVAGERDKYRLFVMNYTGTAKDGLRRQNGMMFSTNDEDNDTWDNYHCAREWSGGWWYNNCWFVILNGNYFNNSMIRYRGISWNDWKTEQLKRSEMKISPSDYM